VAGAAIPCDGTGQDGETQAGVSVSPRFSDNQDGTILDNLTGLIWLKDASCVAPGTWISAIHAATALASGACGLSDGSVAGDWRLPNVKELQSLLDYGQANPALPVDQPFDGYVRGDFWSSTSYPYGPGYAWWVRFDNGNVRYESKTAHCCYALPVRGGSEP
jgi:hypothetical protein